MKNKLYVSLEESGRKMSVVIDVTTLLITFLRACLDENECVEMTSIAEKTNFLHLLNWRLEG
jgi:hypothetical protein